MTLSTLTLRDYRTPKGATVQMAVRDGTADHNNVYSCLNEDEYGLAELSPTGTALDIGAHIGGVTVALAKDNPELRVVAVECLSANVELLTENVERNGLSDRVTVLHAIAGREPGTGTVRWNFGGGEAADHHRFIANAQNIPHDTADSEEAPLVTLPFLVTLVGGPFAFAKIDCEGCEYEFLASDTNLPILLADSCVRDVAEIRGEFHAGFQRIVELLDPTHVVTLTSGTEAFGGFRAVRR